SRLCFNVFHAQPSNQVLLRELPLAGTPISYSVDQSEEFVENRVAERRCWGGLIQRIESYAARFALPPWAKREEAHRLTQFHPSAGERRTKLANRASPLHVPQETQI